MRARALGLPQAEMDAALTRLQEQGRTQPLTLAEIPGPAWLWVGE